MTSRVFFNSTAVQQPSPHLKFFLKYFFSPSCDDAVALRKIGMTLTTDQTVIRILNSINVIPALSKKPRSFEAAMLFLEFPTCCGRNLVPGAEF